MQRAHYLWRRGPGVVSQPHFVRDHHNRYDGDPGYQYTDTRALHLVHSRRRLLLCLAPLQQRPWPNFGGGVAIRDMEYPPLERVRLFLRNVYGTAKSSRLCSGTHRRAIRTRCSADCRAVRGRARRPAVTEHDEIRSRATRP